MSEQPLICSLCQCPLDIKRVDFEYVGHTFFADAPRCPRCGQVYLSEQLPSVQVLPAGTARLGADPGLEHTASHLSSSSISTSATRPFTSSSER